MCTICEGHDNAFYFMQLFTFLLIESDTNLFYLFSEN